MKYGVYVLFSLLSAASLAQQSKPTGEKPASDESQIRKNRLASNAAIEAHDTAGIAKHWAPGIHVVTSRNAQLAGRRQNVEAFAKEFSAKPGLVYVRTADRVEVSPSTGMASETGTWVGRWKHGAETVTVSGTYYAKWIRSGSEWLIRAEVYTLLTAQDTDLQYFGQAPAAGTWSLFAPGIISRPDRNEFGSIYSKDGKEFYYAVETNGKADIRFMKLENNKWSESVVLMTHDQYSYNDPYLTPDEKRLFFISDRPLSGTGPKKDYDIWYIERQGAQWSAPVNAGPAINSPKNEYYISFTKTGAMYFSSNVAGTEGAENYDIYTCRYTDGAFQPAVRLGPAVNSPGYEADVYVDPDETYLIYCSNRPGTYGRGDLFISYKTADGSWTPAKNMGKEVNEERTEYCPFVTPDGKYLLFTAKEDIRWVDAGIIERLRK